MPEKKYLYGASVIIVYEFRPSCLSMLTGGLSEGIMALQSPELRALYDLKVFVVSPGAG